MTDELKAGHLYKRLCICEAAFGDADWYLTKLGSTLSQDRKPQSCYGHIAETVEAAQEDTLLLTLGMPSALPVDHLENATG